MKKIYPSESIAAMTIAIDIQKAKYNKFSVTGLFPSHTITLADLPELQTPPAIPSLCLMWIFPDGQGVFNTQMSVFNPHGQLIDFQSPQRIKKTARGAMSLMARISPFPCSITGIYESRVILDDWTYSRNFKIE